MSDGATTTDDPESLSADSSRNGSETVPPSLEERVNRFDAAHATSDLQLDAGQLEDARDDRLVARGAACGIQVHDMHAGRSCGHVTPRDLDRIVRIDDGVVVVALGQSDAAAAEDVDRRDDLHALRLNRASGSS